MPTQTVAYNQRLKGFPSFYSYVPDFMMGMNQHFYTFKGGNLYRHNTNEANRNQFYGGSSASSINFVFNDAPLENKLFKTLAIEGTHAWQTELESNFTDIPCNMQESFYEEKEGTFFSFIRTASYMSESDQQVWELRTLSGIGSSAFTLNYQVGFQSYVDVMFPVTVDIGTQVSIGDKLFLAQSPAFEPQQVGTITAINVDLPNGVNTITAQNQAGTIAPVEYFLYIKNPTAENFGLLGKYMTVQFQNSTYNQYVELFAVRSEVMKSFP